VSLCLNTYGTFFFTEVMNRMAWVGRINGVLALNLFLLPKIVVSFLVAFFWNYQMQRKFVYRSIPFNKRFISHKR
ncbi:MAG: GtrA family protein, partial [Porphyromonadaceae bacterium]|nr:GtrA family protein [Porphyromonadaceae bacterium]